VSYIKGLRCRECGREAPAAPLRVCDACFGPLEVQYDYEGMVGRITRQSIQAGPLSMWRYRDLLPLEGEPVTGSASGWTPLRRARNLERLWGCKEIWIKDDSVNCPTLSYKDRVVSLAVSKAVEFGFKVVGCASTGNLANSVSAHAAAAGLEAWVLIPHNLEQGKILGSQVFGPKLVKVRGNYDDVNRLCVEIADKYNWAIVNVNLRPYYTEGAKTFGYEIIEQLGWRLPDHVVIPTAGGTILPKVWKGFRELVSLGLVEDKPCAVHTAQAAGCNPVVTALHEGSDLIKPQKPNTIAKSIAIGDPADGYYVVRVVQESGGWGESATDDEIIEGIQLLARTEGIWTEPAGGTTVAVTKKLIDQGRIDKDACIVIAITGNGYKTQEVLLGRLAPAFEVGISLKEFDALLREIQSRTGARGAAVSA